MENKIKSTRAFIRARYIKKDFTEKLISRPNNVCENNKKNKIYIFLASDYGNMGDIAITYAQKEFIKKYSNNKYDIEEIPLSKTYNYIKKINIRKDDIITIIGGGNMGDRYEWIEEARRTVIKNFPQNKIISFPQTCEFSNTNLGRESLRRSKKIYNKSQNLYVFAREKKSYNIMKEYFKNTKIFLVPDIVFSMKEKIEEVKMDKNFERNKVGICLRDDSEKELSDENTKQILNFFDDSEIYKFDTHIGNENLNYAKRYEQLYDLLNEIKSMKLVVTDRLHGMIFAYITNTPCIVFDNVNHKIYETYETWLKQCDSILLLDKFEKEIVEKFIYDINSNQIKSNQIKFNYNDLKNIIKQ